MFTPDQEKAAQELLRVCKPGGKIGLANWVPDGYVGNMFRTVGKHFPPPPGVKPPPLWGTEDRLRELLGAGGTRFEFECYDVGHLYNLAFFLEAPEEARAVLDSVNTFHPLGRHGQPEDVVEAILFLASTEAGWITGTTLPIDGGVLAGRSPAAA